MSSRSAGVVAVIVVVLAGATYQPGHHGHGHRAHDVSFALPGPTTTSSNEQLGMRMAARAGWDSDQQACLDWLWTRESNWEPEAENPRSGAYGIPQSLPASKMASAGSDWRTNRVTQIRWGLGYIKATYGSPCGAWLHETAYGWY